MLCDEMSQSIGLRISEHSLKRGTAPLCLSHENVHTPLPILSGLLHARVVVSSDITYSLALCACACSNYLIVQVHLHTSWQSQSKGFREHAESTARSSSLCTEVCFPGEVIK